MVTGIIVVIIGYLLGSVPSAYIVGRMTTGIDIRDLGGGNMGALNTMREIGFVPGIVVLIADIAKGSIVILLAGWLAGSEMWTLAAGFAAVVGHNWPVFLKFRGGRGAATTLGVLLALVPLELGLSLIFTLIVLVITSNVRLGIAVGLAALPVVLWQLNGSGLLISYSLILAAFLGTRALLDLRKTAGSEENKDGLIFDKQYHFWQSRRK
jgi:glycerol-3-phosphate acyltransferase PlsY